MGDIKRPMCRRQLHAMEGDNVGINSHSRQRFCRACRNEYTKQWRLSHMQISLWWSDKIDMPNRDSFIAFLQRMVKRIIAGHVRYGTPNKRKRYMTRLKMELKEYEKTGNVEHLYNIANYAYLESEAPENPKFHFNEFVESVTRGRGLE